MRQEQAVDLDSLSEITETCRRCGTTTTEWTAVMLVHHTAHLDEIEVTDAEPLTVLCRCCADGVEPGLRSVVTGAVSGESP